MEKKKIKVYFQIDFDVTLAIEEGYASFEGSRWKFDEDGNMEKHSAPDEHCPCTRS